MHIYIHIGIYIGAYIGIDIGISRYIYLGGLTPDLTRTCK
jgi:hypothetical protein